MSEIIIGTFFIILFLLLQMILRRDNTTLNGAPFVPLDADIIERILNHSHLKKGNVFYDLGSGDGRLVIAAALKGAKAYGIEIDPWRVFYSRLWISLLRLSDNAHIIQGDVFSTNLSDADIVTAYLLPETHITLEKKLEKELKNGTRVVGVAFAFPSLKPTHVDPRGPIYGPLYFYTIEKKLRKRNKK